MAQAGALSQNANLITALAGLPKTLFGSSTRTTTTTTPSSQTEQTMLSKEAIDSLLKGILEGTTGRPGLASIVSGQRTAGLYNSAVNTLLVNDLLARAAGEVATKAAPRVVTSTGGVTTRQEQVPGMDLGKTLGLVALGVAGSSKGRDAVAKVFEGITKGTPTTPDRLLEEAMLIDSFNPELATGAADFFGSAAGLENAMLLDSFNPELAGGFDMFGGGLPAGTGRLLQGDVEGAAGTFALSMIPGVGPALSFVDSLTGGNIGSEVGEFAGDFVEGAGDVVKGVGDVVGDVVGSVSIICTELARQGKLSRHLLQAETKINRAYLPAEVFHGYHAIAKPIVRWMRKSERLSNFLLPWVQDHCTYSICGKATYRVAFINAVLIPACYVVGKLVGPQELQSLYQGA